MAPRCKAYIYGCLLVGIAGSNPAGSMDILSRVSVTCCQVEVSETGRCLVQRRPTKYVHVCACVCVCLCVIECDEAQR